MAAKHKIAEWELDIINGYIKQIVVSKNIPQLIAHLCALYFSESDHFETNSTKKALLTKKFYKHILSDDLQRIYWQSVAKVGFGIMRIIKNNSVNKYIYSFQVQQRPGLSILEVERHGGIAFGFGIFNELTGQDLSYYAHHCKENSAFELEININNNKITYWMDHVKKCEIGEGAQYLSGSKKWRVIVFANEPTRIIWNDFRKIH